MTLPKDLYRFHFPQHPESVAIAVSGGSDSMALALMSQRWANTFSPKVKMIPMIVDHGLRQGSDTEACWTRNQLLKRGLCPTIIHWKHGPLSSGLMAKARQKRYELLALECHKMNIKYLLTAHHNDDVLETFWMRQKKESGPHGLSGLSSITKRYGVIVMRPLLAHRKVDLQDFLVTNQQQWVEDPSNTNPIFFRTHARKYIDSLDPSEKKSLSENIKERSHKRQQEESYLAQKYPIHINKTYLHIPWGNQFQEINSEQGSIILRSWLSFFTFSQHYTHRLSLLWQQIVQKMSHASHKETGIIANGGGCLFFKQKRDLFVLRESGRIPQIIDKKIDHVWDHRWFCYGVCPKIPETPTIGSLKDKLITSTVPSNSSCPSIIYQHCGYAFPSFSTSLPWNLDKIAFI
jgi:tRNA(Ile)-lysidine synthase